GIRDSSVTGVQTCALPISEAHLAALETAGYDLNPLGKSKMPIPTEVAAYRKLGLKPIPPELREGHDEVLLAARGRIPALVSVDEIGRASCRERGWVRSVEW